MLLQVPRNYFKVKRAPFAFRGRGGPGSSLSSDGDGGGCHSAGFCVCLSNTNKLKPQTNQRKPKTKPTNLRCVAFPGSNRRRICEFQF